MHSITDSMKTCATCGTMALPNPRSLSILAVTPLASGKTPGSMGLQRSSVQGIQSASFQNPAVFLDSRANLEILSCSPWAWTTEQMSLAATGEFPCPADVAAHFHDSHLVLSDCTMPPSIPDVPIAHLSAPPCMESRPCNPELLACPTNQVLCLPCGAPTPAAGMTADPKR